MGRDRMAGTPAVPTGPQPVTTAGIVLRAWDPDLDADMVAEAARDGANRLWNPFLPDPVEGGREAAVAWCRARADWSGRDHASWAVARPEQPDRAVGSISLHQIDRAHGSAHVGYWVAPAHRRQGLAGRALVAAAAHAFDALGLQRVVLYHGTGNLGSCRTAKRAGFRLEGIHRRSYRYGDGLLHDEHCHARLRGDATPAG